VTSALVIGFNACLILFETDWRAKHADEIIAGRKLPLYDLFFVSANAFCVIFTADLLLRWWAEGNLFFFSRERGWNIFDIFVCGTALLEASVQFLMSHASLDSEVRIFLRKFSMLRIIRLLRIVRVARGLKFIKHVRELRMMVFSLTGSFKPLIWSAVLIIIILMVFAVFFTDGVIAYCELHNLMHSETTDPMRNFFGRVHWSAMSLFMAMTGGEDWGNIMATLRPLPPEYTLLFIFFVSFAVLALLNLVTAVFINTAMSRSQNDRELVVQQEMESKAEIVLIIQQVFMELDTDGSGSLTIEEFEKHIEDEKIQAYLKSRQIDVRQVRTLFTLLDSDQTGDVSMEQFVDGILRLKGGATSMDLAVLTYQVEYMVQVLATMTGAERPQTGMGVNRQSRFSTPSKEGDFRPGTGKKEFPRPPPRMTIIQR